MNIMEFVAISETKLQLEADDYFSDDYFSDEHVAYTASVIDELNL